MSVEQIIRAEVLDGRRIAEEIKQQVRTEVAHLWQEEGIKPCLAAVRVGEDPASAVYVRNKVRTSEELGLASEQHALVATTTTEVLIDLIDDLNRRDDVDGILVQLPLPNQIDEAAVI